MTAEFMDTLFLGLLTYLGHSTVFLTLGLLITGFALMKNHALKEMILRFALFGALITTPLHLSGAFDPFFQPIKIPEETVKSEPASLGVNEPVVHETLPSVPTVTTETRALSTGGAELPVMNEAGKTFSFTLANIVLMLWALIGAAFLFQLGYLIFDLKRQLAGRIDIQKGRAVKMTGTLSNIAGIPTPRLSKKENLAGPFCLGTGEIVLPMWAEDLPRHQLKALLAHEIAHIKRSDPSWILAARIVQSIFFFQPLNIFAARRLSELSEFACDAWAGKVCGSGMPLAECLAECAKRHLGRAPSALGAAMATKRSPIVERTQMLLAGIRDYAKPASGLSKVVVLGAFIIGGTMIPVFAFDEIAPEISPAVSPPPDVEPLPADLLQSAAPLPEVKPVPAGLLQSVAPLPDVKPLQEALLAEEAALAEEAEAILTEEEALRVEKEAVLAEEAAMLAEEVALQAEEELMEAEEAAIEEALEVEESALAHEAASFKTAMAASDEASSSTYIHIDNGGFLDIKVSFSDDDRKLKIRGEGKFRFNDAETEMVEMSDDSYLDFTETTDAYTRRVRFEGHSGRIEETYWLDGDEVSKDAATSRWLVEAIPSMYRLTGIDASGRTKRIFEARGVDGVLDEIPLIPGSYTKHFPAGDYQVSCALIIGKRKASTNLKTSLNNALREFDVAV